MGTLPVTGQHISLAWILVSTNSTPSYPKNSSSPHRPTKFLHSAGAPCSRWLCPQITIISRCPGSAVSLPRPPLAASKQKLLGVSSPAYINWESSGCWHRAAPLCISRESSLQHIQALFSIGDGQALVSIFLCT